MQVLRSNLMTKAPPAPVVPRSAIRPKPDLKKPKLPSPWERVLKKLGMRPSEVAKALGRDHSSVTRAINRYDGLILPWYQVQLLKLARKRGVMVTPADLAPTIEE